MQIIGVMDCFFLNFMSSDVISLVCFLSYFLEVVGDFMTAFLIFGFGTTLWFDVFLSLFFKLGSCCVLYSVAKKRKCGELNNILMIDRLMFYSSSKKQEYQEFIFWCSNQYMDNVLRFVKLSVLWVITL